MDRAGAPEQEVRLTFAGPAERVESEPEIPVPDLPQLTASTGAAQPAPVVSRTMPDGTIMDGKGRRLKLRELTILQELDLMDIAGDTRTMNRVWWVNVSTAAKVEFIDGMPVPFPTTLPELRAMLARVDRDGIAAVLDHLSSPEENAPAHSDEARAKN